jgi:hypothetical protein
MKILTILFCLFLSVGSLAQSTAAVHKDTIYVIDGELSGKKKLEIDPKTILSINVLKYSPNIDKHMSSDDITVLIITKKYAIKSYQDKLSAFSVEYKQYLESHKNDDSDLLYVLNKGVNGNSTELLKELYEVTLKKIKKVAFLDWNNKYNVINKSIVVVRTKK